MITEQWPIDWFHFFHSVCTYSILCTMEPAMEPIIYWGRLLIMKFQFAGAMAN